MGGVRTRVVTVKLEGRQAEGLRRLVEAGLFSSRSEAVRAAVVAMVLRRLPRLEEGVS